MKRVLFWFIVASAISCNSSKVVGGEQFKKLRLNFRGCGEELDFRAISILVPEGYDLKRVIDNHGFCEYQLWYGGYGTLYVSSNIYSGSPLNYENRLRAGIGTYSDNRDNNDQITVRGVQEDGKYWVELITGKYAAGFVNITDSTFFKNSLQQIELID